MVIGMGVVLYGLVEGRFVHRTRCARKFTPQLQVRAIDDCQSRRIDHCYAHHYEALWEAFGDDGRLDGDLLGNRIRHGLLCRRIRH